MNAAVLTEQLRISAIRVFGLFGLYDHEVVLHSQERITIIHGPNGIGKTVFLRIVSQFLNGRVADICRTPFRELRIDFNDGTKAGMRKDNEGDQVRVVVFFVSKDGDSTDTALPTEILNPEKLAERIERSSPYLVRIGPGEWIDRRSDEVLTASEVVDSFHEALSEKERSRFLKDVPALRSLRERVKTHFIETQRLIKVANLGEMNSRYGARVDRERQVTETVQEYSKELKRRISESLNEYAKQSQRLDQSFPQRLLDPNTPERTIPQLEIDFKSIEAQRAKLKNIGLVDDSEAGDFNSPVSHAALGKLDRTQAKVMSLYVDDTKSKLGVLQELVLRVEVLLESINKKFSQKQLQISKAHGLMAVRADGGTIPLSALSSGEQQEIVLFFDLLFKVRPNTLVLIDEPELSLHVSWQKGFLDDLAQIISIADFDVVLATHSPFIVGDRSDLMVSLSPTGRGAI